VDQFYENTAQRPLIVDLDGTLLRTDSLHENLIRCLMTKPYHLLKILAAARGGIAAVKAVTANLVPLPGTALCYRASMLTMIRQAKASGRPVHLVTAADQSIAQAVQENLGCFDSVKGSDGVLNLKGVNKLSWIQSAFPDGFAYAGDSRADLPIWRAADEAVLVGKGVAFAPGLAAAGIPTVTVPDATHAGLGDWRSALRLHQWAKNILIFVPLFLGHIAGDLQAVLRTLAAFICFGLVASATYIINDLADLEADRLHATKRFRAMADGRIPVAQGVLAAAALLLVGGGLCAALSLPFGAMVGLYLVLTLSYSFRLKRMALYDTVIIGVLFTLRIVMGSVLNDLTLSPWLIAFSGFLFFSLALAKRHVEVMRCAKAGLQKLPGRGYYADDWALTLAYGLSSAMCAIVVMLIFVYQGAGPVHYGHPAWLYVEPGCVFLWSMRIWLLSHRMILNDDPVIFALRDRSSFVLGAFAAAGFMLAL
jgi:4-hydroxybenzoate polyprenyltransferase/phosphoserine phosphatase